MTDPPLSIGSAVVSRHDPGLRGQVVGGPRQSPTFMKWRVQWNDGRTGWVPEYELQLAPPVPPDARKLLRNRRFCDHSDLKRTIVFSQITGKLSNLVYSMGATNTEFYPYQYKPLLTFLESPSNGILIADEVGLGKTIEAGLIWTELRARYDARRLLVVCPAMLRDKWVSELQYRFGVDARKLDAKELLHEIQKAPRYRAPPQAFVCSIQGLRPPKRSRGPDATQRHTPRAKLGRALKDEIANGPLFDLVIIDEAHYLRNRKTQSAKLGRLLRDVSQHIVPLSATPVNNKNEDLFQLLHLVDPDTFFSSDVFPSILDANAPLVRARQLAFSARSTAEEIIKELQAAADHPLLSNSKVLADIVRTVDQRHLEDRANRVQLANRIAEVNLLGHVVSRTRKREVDEFRVLRRPISCKVEMASGGVEEDFYNKVTAAIQSYARTRGSEAGFLLSLPQQMMSSCMYAAAKSWSSRYSPEESALIAYETIGDELEQADARPETNVQHTQPLVAHIARQALSDFDWQLLRHTDSKFEAFRDWLQDFMSDNPDDKVIVFSFFKGTLHYLSTRLRDEGVTTQVLHGGVKENKQEAIVRFKESAGARVLLTSEVASEGVDLQFAKCIANYDLPWNPMKIEQRIGRIDRIGQRSPYVVIVNFMYADTVDERIYTRLLEKLRIFERALGGLEAILGEQVSKLATDLMTSTLTRREQEERISQAAIAIENMRVEQEQLEENAAHLMAHEERILENVKAAHRDGRRISSDDLKEYVEDYLYRRWQGSGFVFRESPGNRRAVEIRLPYDLCARLSAYVRENQFTSGTSLTDGQQETYVFSRKIAGIGHRRERITQFHPLIRFIGSELAESAAEFCPLVAVQMSSKSSGDWLGGVYVFVLRRWHFSGSRQVEELKARAMLLNGSEMLDLDQSLALVSAAKTYGTDWRAARVQVSIEATEAAIDRAEDRLQEDYEQARRERENSNDDRVDVQVESLRRQMKRQTASWERLLVRSRMANDRRQVAMTEGKLRKVRNRFETQIAERELGRRLTSRKYDLCAGVILVTGS